MRNGTFHIGDKHSWRFSLSQSYLGDMRYGSSSVRYLDRFGRFPGSFPRTRLLICFPLLSRRLPAFHAPFFLPNLYESMNQLVQSDPMVSQPPVFPTAGMFYYASYDIRWEIIMWETSYNVGFRSSVCDHDHREGNLFWFSINKGKGGWYTEIISCMTSMCDYAEKGGERSGDVSFKRTNQGEYDICVYVYSIL